MEPRDSLLTGVKEMSPKPVQGASVTDEVDRPLSIVKQEPLTESGEGQPVLKTHNNSDMDFLIIQAEQEPIDQYDTDHTERCQESTNAPGSPQQINDWAYSMYYRTGENEPACGQRSVYPVDQLKLAVSDEVTSYIHTAEGDNVHYVGGINPEVTCDPPFPVAIFKHQKTSERNVRTHASAEGGHTGGDTGINKKSTGKSKPHICPVCDFRFVYEAAFLKHMRRHTEDSEKPYSCIMCDYKSARKGNLVDHIRTHTGERPYECPHCDYKSAVQTSLTYHLRIHTGEKPHKCSECDYRSNHAYNLVVHVRKHTGEKPYSCTQCEYRCTTGGSLAAHKRTHTAEKPYTCLHCDYTCTVKNSLVKHVRIHTGEKPYKCSFPGCGYECTQGSTLKCHMRVHSGEKPYICSQCDFRSAHRGSLVSHMKKHLGDKPCDVLQTV